MSTFLCWECGASDKPCPHVPAKPPTPDPAKPSEGRDELNLILGRINEYLALGGFWNPEAMDHDKVRRLLLDARAAIEAALAARAPAAAQGGGLAVLAERVSRWVRHAFTDGAMTDLWERAARVVEEAVELGQAQGLSEVEAFRIMRRVYDRPSGEPKQEAGGLMVTLLAWAGATATDLDAVTLAEIERIEQPATIERIRAKQAEKAAAGTGRNYAAAPAQAPAAMPGDRPVCVECGFPKGPADQRVNDVADYCWVGVPGSYATMHPLPAASDSPASSREKVTGWPRAEHTVGDAAGLRRMDEPAATPGAAPQHAAPALSPHDAPGGKAWFCPGCSSWATLRENAQAHMLATRHGVPTCLLLADAAPAIVDSLWMIARDAAKFAEGAGEPEFSRFLDIERRLSAIIAANERLKEKKP